MLLLLLAAMTLVTLLVWRVAQHATERARLAEEELSDLRIDAAVMRGALGLIRLSLDAVTARKLAREALEETL